VPNPQGPTSRPNEPLQIRYLFPQLGRDSDGNLETRVPVGYRTTASAMQPYLYPLAGPELSGQTRLRGIGTQQLARAGSYPEMGSADGLKFRLFWRTAEGFESLLAVSGWKLRMNLMRGNWTGLIPFHSASSRARKLFQ
jgi:hypothetical protein